MSPVPDSGNDSARHAEFRRDPHSGEWVTIAGSRQSRPALPATCPFCVGGLEAPEAYTVKAFTNRWPVMRPADAISGTTEDLLDRLREGPEKWAEDSPVNGAGNDTAAAIGDAEVILYTPEHEGSLGALPPSQLEAVWSLWTERTAALASRNEVASVLIFENRGEEVGVTIHHPHGQIYAFPFLPPRQRRELELLRLEASSGKPCTTCTMLANEAHGDRFLAAVGDAVAYVPFASAWPYAAHIVLRRHAGALTDLDAAESADLRDLLARVLLAGDRIFGRPLPTMMAFLQGPVDGSDPECLWHMRIEVVSPLRKRETQRYVAAAEVSSGTFANPVLPEDAAHQWRKALEAGS